MPTISNLTPKTEAARPKTPPRRRQSAKVAARSGAPTPPPRTPPRALTGTPEAAAEDDDRGPQAPPDPETRARPKRRTFTTPYKRKIILEASAMSPSERGFSGGQGRNHPAAVIGTTPGTWSRRPARDHAATPRGQ